MELKQYTMNSGRLWQLDALFHSKTIAFVGASEEPTKCGFTVLNSILRGGWQGDIYPVNPGREQVLSMKAYPTVRDMPEAVDLAVMTVPAKHIPAVIYDCVARQVKIGLIITATGALAVRDELFADQAVLIPCEWIQWCNFYFGRTLFV